jgi:hypothetical protein
MKDPKLTLFGVILVIAGMALGAKAFAASNARDQFDAQHQPSPTGIPNEEQDRENLDKHMELGHSAQVWWIIASVTGGIGLVVTLTSLIGKTPPPKASA